MWSTTFRLKLKISKMGCPFSWKIYMFLVVGLGHFRDLPHPSQEYRGKQLEKCLVLLHYYLETMSTHTNKGKANCFSSKATKPINIRWIRAGSQ